MDLFISKEKNKFNTKKFILSNKYLIQWDPYKILAINLDTKLETKLDFEIQRSENNGSEEYLQRKRILDVRIGSNSKYLAILININMNCDCIIIWNILINAEKIAVDVSKSYEVLWDNKGYPYIVEEDRIWLIKERIYLTCFEKQEIVKVKDLNKNFNSSYGHRFNGESRNFFINSNYLSMPFSFMHFAIKNKIEIQDVNIKSIVFDPTPYNYLFNNSTAFLDSSFVRQNHQELEYVLQNLQQLNVSFLNQLHY